jgi:hypothetical protein
MQPSPPARSARRLSQRKPAQLTSKDPPSCSAVARGIFRASERLISGKVRSLGCLPSVCQQRPLWASLWAWLPQAWVSGSAQPDSWVVVIRVALMGVRQQLLNDRRGSCVSLDHMATFSAGEGAWAGLLIGHGLALVTSRVARPAPSAICAQASRRRLLLGRSIKTTSASARVTTTQARSSSQMSSRVPAITCALWPSAYPPKPIHQLRSAIC